jgi:hypothetical protein
MMKDKGTKGAKDAKGRVEFVSTRSRIEKLGIKEDADVLLLGIEDDATFMKELRGVGAAVRTAGKAQADVIVAVFRHRDDLRRVAPLVPRMKADGVLWTLRPKGSKDLTESEMMRAGQAAGLVDVKVVSFSNVLTAEKFVVPVARRRAHPAIL